MNFAMLNLTIQKFPVPDFVPVPSAGIIQVISIVSLIVGICLVIVGLFFLFLYKRNVFIAKKRGREKKATAPWILIGVGVLLIVNHGIRLLF